MPDDNRPYTAEEVKGIAQAYEKEPGFVWRNKIIDDQRKLRYRRKAVGHPRINESLEVRSPIINRDVQRYVRRLAAARLVVRATAKTADDAEKANRLKQFCHRDYVAINRGQLFVPEYRVSDRQAADGIGWYRLRWHPRFAQEHLSLQENGQVRGYTGGAVTTIPFVIETPDPAAIYYDPDMRQVAEIGYLRSDGTVLSGDTTTQGEAAVAWTLSKYVVRLETDNYHYDLVTSLTGEDQSFSVQPNLFGRRAYVPVPGLVTGQTNPAEAFLAIVADLYPHVAQKNFLDTLQNNAADLTGAPMFYLRRGATGQNPADWMIVPQTERPEVKIDTEKGTIDITEGFDPVPLSLTAGIDLIRAKEALAADMADVGFPTVLGAPQEVSATSGYARARMESSVSYDLAIPLGNHARAWRELFILQIEALKKLGVSVTFRTIHQDGERELFEPIISRGDGDEITFTPEDAVDVDLAVSFSSDTTEGRIAREEEGIRLVEAGMKSETEFFAEDRRVEDVPAAMRQRDLDQLKANARKLVIGNVMPELLSGWVQDIAAERRGRRKTPRPPRGATGPGQGATLVQPTTPGPIGGEPALGGVEGEA